jgi:hypothetical protein
LVEQGTENPRVRGSIPRLGTISKFHDQAYSDVGFFVSGVWPAIHQSPCRDLGGPVIPRLGTISKFHDQAYSDVGFFVSALWRVIDIELEITNAHPKILTRTTHRLFEAGLPPSVVEAKTALTTPENDQ